MKAKDGFTTPIWTESLAVPSYAEPVAGMHAEVIVVGAGISGLTTAYLLAKEGRDVIVLDEGRIGAGQTERTSAHLASIIDDRFAMLERRHNAETARLACESHAAAIDRIEQIVKAEHIDCDFARVEAYLFAGPDGNEKIVDEEFDPARRAGARATKVSAVPELTNAGRAIRFANQGVFHAGKYIVGLANAATRAGVRIFTGRRVQDVAGARPKNGEPAKVTLYETEQVLTANHAVVATNVPTPINDWMTIYMKQAAHRTYMVGLAVKAGSVPDALYWDTHDPYHYARVLRRPDAERAEHDVLLVGGEDHKTGQGAGDERFTKLIEWARKVFPQAKREVCRWSGQVVEPPDGLAYIGRAPTSGENVYCITGDSGMGLTHGTLGAMLIADLIAGRSNPWEKIYDPHRTPVTTELLADNANTTRQYADYLTPGEIKSEDDLQPGQGGVIRSGLVKLAVYRDDDGDLHRMSAVCPHLKCIVHWNPVEKSFDCPCHGSRFDCRGKLLMGPSYSDLPTSEPA